LNLGNLFLKVAEAYLCGMRYIRAVSCYKTALRAVDWLE